MTLPLSSFPDEKSSDENAGIRRTVNTSSSVPFQEKRLGLGLYPREEGAVHVKIQKGMLVQFCVFEIWANLFFLLGGGGGGGVENWLYVLRLRKATATVLSNFSTAIAM